MMNKKQLTLFLMMLLYGVSMCFASGEDVINLQHVGNHDDHSEYYAPADMPEVYYDSDNLEIIIVADGFSSYYNVEITLTTSYMPLISTQVDGYGDTIDVSSLPDGYYVIVITSEYNNVYQGYFNNY